MTIRVRCPGCNRVLKAPDRLAGKTVRCPNCQRVLKIPAAPNADDAGTPQDLPARNRHVASRAPRHQEEPGRAKTTRVRCPGCKSVLNAPDRLAGKAVRCPKCKRVLKMRGSQNAGESAPEALPDRRSRDVAAPKAPNPQPAAGRSPKPPVRRPARAAPPSPAGPSPAAQLAPAVPEVLEEIESIEPLEGLAALEQLAGSALPAGPVSRARPVARVAGPLPRGPAWKPDLLSREGWLYWLFALTLIPLAFSLLSGPDDIEERLERTLKSRPEIAGDVAAKGSQMTDDKFFSLLPGERIDGAYLPRKSQTHWQYALGASLFFFVAGALLFSPGNAQVAHVLLVAGLTGTAGIIFLLAVQWLAEATAGHVLIGRSIIVLFFYLIKFIAFSYQAAMDPETGFLMSFLGFTFGVGFCEELTKALPLVFHFRNGGNLDWRGACLWGLASGIGFGVAEGVMYSAEFYNGLTTGGIYVVRFISCAGLHAMWAAAAGIAMWRRRKWVQADGLLGTLLWVLAVPMVLHGLYDTLLKKDMQGWALLTALGSFGWLVLFTEWTRAQEDPAFAGRRQQPMMDFQ